MRAASRHVPIVVLSAMVGMAATACSSRSDVAPQPSAGATPASTEAASAPVSAPPPVAAPPPPAPAPSPEERLRAEVRSWKSVPFRDNGTTRSGIGNAGFVRAVFQAAFGTTIPASYDEQYKTGKLVERAALVPGDLVFFEGQGFGPFRSHTVGVYLGHDEVALARKEDGVTVVTLSADRWATSYKTARRVPSGPAAAPAFDVALYGNDRARLLREIAEAWTGTLYRAGGTTFAGIGNDEFVREVYGAVYETDLDGDPKTWATMGVAVARDKLEAGDIILYDAGGVGGLVKQRHAGIYISNGEFVSAVRGSAVTSVKLADRRWNAAYITARRIDPDVLARLERPAPSAPPARASASGATNAADVPSEQERRLRAVTSEWQGTPYKLGGTSKSGVDCSAFSRVVYSDVYKVELPRTAEEQERLGAPVERRDLRAGDLVFFRTQGMGPLFKSRHVGVYLGHGEFAQASGRHGVTVSSLDNRYWSRKYHSARRLQPA